MTAPTTDAPAPTEHGDPQTPERAVLLVGGPLDGQVFTADEWAQRVQSTGYIARHGGGRGPALDYRRAREGDWHLLPRTLPLVVRKGVALPLNEWGYVVEGWVWAPGERDGATP
jgi:hypothetical protein